MMMTVIRCAPHCSHAFALILSALARASTMVTFSNMCTPEVHML